MISSFGFGFGLCRPGPCPICGAPFSSCTPDSVAHQARQRTELPEGGSDKSPPSAAAPPPANPTFTTKDYHGELKKTRRRTGGR